MNHPLKFVVLFLIFLRIPQSIAANRALPPILQILQTTPSGLKDIERLISFRWYEKAWEALKAYPSDNEEVVFLKAKALMGLKRYAESLDLFRGLSQRENNPEVRQESILKEAMVLTRLKRYDEAIEIYENQIRGATVGKIRKKWAWRAFKVALESRNYNKGLKLLQWASGAEGGWWRGWCLFRLGHLERALKQWEPLGSKKHKDYYPRSLYWRAHLLKELNRPEEAIKLLETLAGEPLPSYYGFLALSKQIPFQSKWFPSEDGPDRLRWEEKYPRRYRAEIEKEAARRQLDSYLIFALIWQESRFQEEALSSMGAIGIMQLMPQTALTLAKASHLKSFHLEDILQSEVNIRLGCFYMKFLQKLFLNRVPYTLASYNAGEEAVSRWLDLREREPEEIFIEEIPFDETQDYVKKVLTAYWIYHWLYEGQWLTPLGGMVEGDRNVVLQRQRIF